MNYFELFEIPVSLQIDRNALSKKYFELQKKCHPDFFYKAGEQEQGEMLEKASMINNGFKIFQHADETLKYVLQIKGLLQENEKYELSPDFLMEMMELNETMTKPDILFIEETATKISQLETQLYQCVQNIIENYNEETTTNEQLLLVKDYYHKKKYLNRISERLEGLRNLSSQT
jgi:molecular chaperone HscB